MSAVEAVDALRALSVQVDPPEQTAALGELAARLRSPRAFVSVIGETSTGKTTLINGLLGRGLLPTSAAPNTAVVTRVVCTGSASPGFAAIERNGVRRGLTQDAFVAASVKSDPALLRLELDVSPSDPAHRGLDVFDTPGFNSLISEHEEVLREFLPQSDVVVLVAGYRTGVGQVDQELYELVRDATSGDPEIPIVFVVNRAPVGTGAADNRVVEMLRNATDSMHREPKLVIVETTELVEGRPSELPRTGPLWGLVQSIVSDRERAQRVSRKVTSAVLRMVDEMDAAMARREVVLRATEADIGVMKEGADELKDARRKSLECVSRCIGRMETQLPGAVEAFAVSILATLRREVEAADKWLGADDCAAWISNHALPLEAKRAAAELERLIAVELERLDAELSEIGNTAVRSLERGIHLPSKAAAEFALGVSRALAERLGGLVTRHLLQGFGGVGGAAAGAGNLVKMLVKRIGNALGKQFGREIYRQIGKLFTKRMLQALSAAGAVFIEGAIFVYEAKTWRKELLKRVAEALAKWRELVTEELISKQVPGLRRANEELVGGIYDGLIGDQERDIRDRRSAEPALKETAGWRAELARIRGLLVH